MKLELFDFQSDALATLRETLNEVRRVASIEKPRAISFSAPTGAGKTIVMTALFEDILWGEVDLEAQPDAVILWISDMPELNEQTRMKIEGKSDKIRVRQLITIDSTFDAERLESGRVYFINTQKLGTDKLLTRKGDGRQYTIWETLTNTAKAIPDRFYVVIDEAHRGMKSGNAAEKAKTILQRFLLGASDHGLCKMPLVIGVSATPQRFDALLTGTIHTTHKVYIPGDRVRKSGLLKDRILIHYPDVPTQAEMTLVAEAARRWQTLERSWATYCKTEKEPTVYPILVMQVEDGTKAARTKTDLRGTLTALEGAIGRKLREGEVAHTFNDSGSFTEGGWHIRRIEASRIEDEKNIGVVLFKMSLSTGWDCPRAEVMMSFRKAQDHTYIAQLLGRMVRTPLARRIKADAALNDVHLFLPHYDKATVDTVIADLQNTEEVPPAETGTSRELVTLVRREGTEKVFTAMQDLVTYRVDAVRKQSAIRRLMALARALTHDQIDNDAQSRVGSELVKALSTEIESLRERGELEARVNELSGIDLKTVAVDHGSGIAEADGEYTIDAESADIDRHFNQAGRHLGNGLHMDYWRAHADEDADTVKLEVVVVAQDHDAMKRIESLSEEHFDQLYASSKPAIAKLNEKRRKHYERLQLSADDPKDLPWELPLSIDFQRSTDASNYEKHLYLESDGKFRADLGAWEADVLSEELADASVVAWLRNVDRKPWALEVPYGPSGSMKPMFPDLLIVRKSSKGYVFDILEPHNPSLDDNLEKAKGLAVFAKNHWHLFGRIQLIRKLRGADGVEKYFRLDVGKEPVRKKVLQIANSEQLNALFAKAATTSGS